MHVSSHFHAHPVSWSELCRWSARASAIVLMACWVVYAVVELFNPDFHLTPELKVQGVALAFVFAGYAVGWRHEVVGGLMAVAGTLAFFAINAWAVGQAPQLPAAWFAAPGVLMLIAQRLSPDGDSHQPAAARKA